MNYLLDTDTCVAILRGRSAAIANASKVSPDDCAVSIITVFELYAGAEKSSRPTAERSKIETLLGAIHQAVFDRAAARQAAELRAHLEIRRSTIGPYDLLIAGHALALGLALVTHNMREFSRVPGLTLEDWT